MNTPPEPKSTENNNERVQKPKEEKSRKRAFMLDSPQNTCSPDSPLIVFDPPSPSHQWKRRRDIILHAIQELEVDMDCPSKQVKRNTEKRKEHVKMDIQLMNGEIPQTYIDLLTRFRVVDIFLTSNAPRQMKLGDIHNYLLLSDIHLSYLEEHVSAIMFFYALKEESRKAYILGRTVPCSPMDPSQLTLKLPSSTGDSKDTSETNACFSRNLNSLFDCLANPKHKSPDLKKRYEVIRRNISSYIEQRYAAYLKRSNQQPLKKGRVSGFTYEELGGLPKSALPPPIAYTIRNPMDILREFQRDVDRAMDNHLLKTSQEKQESHLNRVIDLNLDEEV
ncbi:hypothetical protein WA588_003554 [Blastocystis sp. NMH]